MSVVKIQCHPAPCPSDAQRASAASARERDPGRARARLAGRYEEAGPGLHGSPKEGGEQGVLQDEEEEGGKHESGHEGGAGFGGV